MEDKKPAHILLVEDNPGDVRLIKEACHENRFCHQIYVVNDGEEAMSFLRNREGFSDVPRPDLILLDLNLPKKSGHEVLAEIKGDPDLKSIPVVILTSSDAEQDMMKSGEYNVNGYIVKPSNLEHLVEMVRSIESIWLNTKKD